MLEIALLLWATQTPVVPPRQDGIPIGRGKKKPKVTLTSPAGGWSAGRMMTVAGRVSDRSVDPVTLSINGDRYFIRTRNGRFSRKFPASSGKNVITAMATNRGGTGSAQVTTYAQIPSMPLRVVLTSDTDGVWTDLHIYEPTESSLVGGQVYFSGMNHIYWAETKSPSGGTFYLNDDAGGFDQPGYGPYLYVHRAPPKGVFLVTANYYPSGDKPHTQAMLNVKIFEGTPKEISRRVAVPLATPGTTKAMLWIRFVSGSEAYVYAPGQDPAPTDDGWPTNLAEVAREAEGRAQ